jgi:hypothetical protein
LHLLEAQRAGGGRMSYGHGKNNGVLRDVVDVLSGWKAVHRCGGYLRKVMLSCGHCVAQTGKRERLKNGKYSWSDIRNLTTHKTAYCHICKLESDKAAK